MQAHVGPPVQAGDPHHVELVEVAGEDGEELHPLQQRLVLVLAEREDPRVERQPGQLPVTEPVGGQIVAWSACSSRSPSGTESLGRASTGRRRTRRGSDAGVTSTPVLIAEIMPSGLTKDARRPRASRPHPRAQTGGAGPGRPRCRRRGATRTGRQRNGVPGVCGGRARTEGGAGRRRAGGEQRRAGPRGRQRRRAGWAAAAVSAASSSAGRRAGRSPTSAATPS